MTKISPVAINARDTLVISVSPLNSRGVDFPSHNSVHTLTVNVSFVV